MAWLHSRESRWKSSSVFVRVAASVMPKELSLGLETSYVIRAPEPCATIEEWEARYTPKSKHGRGNGSPVVSAGARG